MKAPRTRKPLTPEQRARHREAQARYRARLWDEAVAHYGGHCLLCAETEGLEFHHPKGGGNLERNEIFHRRHASPGGWNYVLWLKKNGWPSTVVLLCRRHHDEMHPERARHPGRAPDEAEFERELDLFDPVPF